MADQKNVLLSGFDSPPALSNLGKQTNTKGGKNFGKGG